MRQQEDGFDPANCIQRAYPNSHAPQHQMFSCIHRQLCQTRSFVATNINRGRRRLAQTQAVEETALNEKHKKYGEVVYNFSSNSVVYITGWRVTWRRSCTFRKCYACLPKQNDWWSKTGRNGPVFWPPRLSDLFPMGFFAWNAMKIMMYENSGGRTMDLVVRMSVVIANIRKILGIFHKVRLPMQRCFDSCTLAHGRQFEHFL